MCIIVVKNAGVKMPSWDTLNNCFDNNPDGAGFAFWQGGLVHIRKGFFQFEDFQASLSAVLESGIDIDCTPIVMHFRIATHGTVNTGNCHPFPVTPDYKAMRSMQTSASCALFHNGIITATSADSDCKTHNVSDTMVFNRKILAPLYKTCPSIIQNKRLMGMLEYIADSKLVLLDNTGSIGVIGSFYEEGGVLYSNYSYAYNKYSYTNYSYKYVDDYDTWDDYYNGKPKYKSLPASSPITDIIPIPETVFYMNGEGKVITLSEGLFGIDRFGTTYYLSKSGNWLRGKNPNVLFNEDGIEVSYYTYCTEKEETPNAAV